MLYPGPTAGVRDQKRHWYFICIFKEEGEESSTDVDWFGQDSDFTWWRLDGVPMNVTTTWRQHDDNMTYDFWGLLGRSSNWPSTTPFKMTCGTNEWLGLSGYRDIGISVTWVIGISEYRDIGNLSYWDIGISVTDRTGPHSVATGSSNDKWQLIKWKLM